LNTELIIFYDDQMKLSKISQGQ